MTISGGTESVEMARRAIRRLAPLTVTFSLDSQLLQRDVSAAHIMERQERLATVGVLLSLKKSCIIAGVGLSQSYN